MGGLKSNSMVREILGIKIMLVMEAWRVVIVCNLSMGRMMTEQSEQH